MLQHIPTNCRGLLAGQGCCYAMGSDFFCVQLFFREYGRIAIMPTAYTPGLLVTEHTVIRKTRRLPIKGEVLVTAGEIVTADSVVARAMIPGVIQALRGAEKLGVSAAELLRLLKKNVGDEVAADDVLAETKGLFGLFSATLIAPVSGIIEYISPLTGTIGIREHATPLEISAYLNGKVEEVIPQEGAVIATEGSFIQGIFGVGGERIGRLKCIASSPDSPLNDEMLNDSCAGCVLIAGASANITHIRRAIKFGAVGMIVGAVSDAVLRAYLGYDIGVAITGQEELPLTLILTEGFGELSMAERTFALLSSLEGEEAAINGATQIRAGVIRPEIIVPRATQPGQQVIAKEQGELAIGARVRLIREPYFGQFATVTAMPAELRIIETGAMVRVAEVKLINDDVVQVPRANIEMLYEQEVK